MDRKNATESDKAKFKEDLEQKTEILPAQSGVPSFFMNKEVFEHGQRVAIMLSKADLVPKQYQNNVGNCVIALNMANRLGADVLMVMQNLYVVHGKPGWSSSFLIATLNMCGKFSPLRYEEDDLEGGRCRAVATDLKANVQCEGVWVSMEMAKAEGWIDKNGSKWKTMPQLMRRYRAAAFFTRQFAPEVSMGLQTQEELIDVQVVSSEPLSKKESSQVEVEQNRRVAMLQSCTTLDDLELLITNNPDFDADMIAQRKRELTPAKSIEEIQRDQKIKELENKFDALGEKEALGDKGQMILMEIEQLKEGAK